MSVLTDLNYFGLPANVACSQTEEEAITAFSHCKSASSNTQRPVAAGMMVTLINPYVIHFSCFLKFSSLVRFESDVPG